MEQITTKIVDGVKVFSIQYFTQMETPDGSLVYVKGISEEISEADLAERLSRLQAQISFYNKVASTPLVE